MDHPAGVLADEHRLRSAVRRNLTDWAEAVLAPQGFSPAAHHRLLLRHLADVSEGATDRLMILMPPGSAKSTYVSEIFPAWWFSQHPASSVIAASHTAELAHHFGRRVRALILEYGERLGFGLVNDDRAAARWRTSARGQYFATGLRGPISGRRADLVIIDDPVKSQADAESAALRDHAWEWFRADLVTRLKPRGKIILVMTRWHEDDLGGRLLHAGPGDWRVLKLPALAEAGDPLGRVEGAALWPEWEDAAALARKRETVGERVWASLYQQSPRPLNGSMFLVNKLRFVPEGSGQYREVVRAWDFAASEKTAGTNPDFSAGVRLALGFDDIFYVLHVSRFQFGVERALERIRSVAAQDGETTVIGVPQDPGAAGKIAATHVVGQLHGFNVKTSPESGSKIVRAGPVASQVNAGRVAVVQGEWTAAFVDELAGFPFAKKDDQVDALSRAFTMITNVTKPARSTRHDVFRR